jgi:hypothetical protein
MECSDITATRAMFFTMHEIKQVRVANVYDLDETWINQNYTCKSCWMQSKRPPLIEVM